MSSQLAARQVAFDVLRQVSSEDAYANLALAKRLAGAGLATRDAAFATELVSGTCRLAGTYDAIIARAGRRGLNSLQPAVIDLLRLLAHQALSLNTPPRAAVATTVELARARVGQRVTGIVNAIGRRIAAKSMGEWIAELEKGQDDLGALAVRFHHPRWIVEAYQELLPAAELPAALAANNQAPRPTLVVRPGLAEVSELAPAVATRFSPYGAVLDGVPASIAAVQEGRAGVQDEGSQLVALALARADAPSGPWLDLCAGPGGKAALLTGLAVQAGHRLTANEVAPHRARLVAQALSAYPPTATTVVCSDGREGHELHPLGPFSRVMVDAPCSGLGALRRRPESRWRRSPTVLDGLVELQAELLHSAVDVTLPGGVVAYVTCSPHPRETHEVVANVLADRVGAELLSASELLPEVPECASGDFVQLWPHRHGTDAMFLAMLRIH
ncbi:MAG: RsmB/NOP family class I SAM-dependent RNA methyltransferase [Propionibacteriaceae bacterium]|nr:RsmB/NOP family class I SAM-dependent RNA methyltransferase [Propionibacteriaceae bacterium]